MNAKSSLALLLGLAIASAAPAYAKATIQKGESVCKAAVAASEPAPKSVRVDKDSTRANNDELTFTLKVKSAEGVSGTLLCAVDRETLATKVTPAS